MCASSPSVELQTLEALHVRPQILASPSINSLLLDAHPKQMAAGIPCTHYRPIDLLGATDMTSACQTLYLLCFADFKSVQDMTDWLTKVDPKTTPALAQLRGLADSAVRVAIALPAQSYTGAAAKVAKERAAMP